MVRNKYQSVLDLGEKLKIQKGDVQVNGNQLEIRGVANTPYEKDLLWDEIKRIGGENPQDIMADISVADTTVYHRHTVKSGESLSKIAKQYYGDPVKYNTIFKVNRDILNNPDIIHPGQELIIPKIG